jgi:TonB family protein
MSNLPHHRLSARFPLAAAAALSLALPLSLPASASRVVERPGMGITPAFVCLSTTLLSDGRTKDARIVRRSGNGISDTQALRFVRRLEFDSPTSLAPEERNAHVLVRMHQNGTLAFKLFELDEPLPTICGTPFESVARDREINANESTP